MKQRLKQAGADRALKIIRGLAGCALLSLASCVSDEPGAPVVAEDGINVKATLAKDISTRGVVTSGPIEEGTYYVTYTLKSNSEYTVENVEFDESVMDSRGYVPSGLQWSMIKNNNFYMDNAAPDLNKGTKVENVIFGNDNPFVGGIVVPDPTRDNDYVAENDLLWGNATPPLNSKTIDFSLHHVMSKVKVQVTVDRTNAIGKEFDFENAEMTISNVVTEPYSFNRLNGTVLLSEDPQYETIYLVDMKEGGSQLDWLSISEDPENPNIKTYISYDYILPPQGLKDDASRPKLSIKVKTEEYPDGKVFSGYLPHSMEVSTAGEDGAPLPLSFLREHYLTIRTVLSKDPPQLMFQPVWVYEWVDKGEFTSDGYQAGVYDEEDFMALITYYNEGNQAQLRRFGKKDENGAWRFNIFGNLELEKSSIAGTMIPGGTGAPYSFYLDSFFTLSIIEGETVETLKGDSGAAKLYQITSGGSN